MVCNLLASRCVRIRAAALCTGVLAAVQAGAQTSPVGDRPTKVAVAGRSEAETRLVTIDVDRLPLKSVLEHIASQAGLHLVYGNALDSATTRVSLRMRNVPAHEAFDKALQGSDLAATILSSGYVQLVRRTVSHADNVISGLVSDAATKRPIVGASVVLEGLQLATRTDEQGKFRLTAASAGTYQVAVRFLGYGRAVKTVTVSGNGQAMTVDFALEASVNALDQVVVTGTVVATELKAVPNAITVVTAKQIEERGITRIDQLFRGDVPGLFIPNTGSGNSVDDAGLMYSRGATSLATFGNSNPIKTYVDGVEMADPKYLTQIDPRTIERIEILTGPQASTIYGSNALNGVMQIFTKRGTTSHPQLMLNLTSGLVENDFSSARTPQHDYSAQVSGVEGRISYNAGASWNYVGPWTPARQTTQIGALGGARFAFPLAIGATTADATFRRNVTTNRQHGNNAQGWTHLADIGLWRREEATGVAESSTTALTGQTVGLTVGYLPRPWWSHEFTLGLDAEDSETLNNAASFKTPRDTTLMFSQAHTDRRTFRYSTTVRAPISSVAQATVSLGADTWKNLVSSASAFPARLTGVLSQTSLQRQPGHNTGGFLQAQLAFADQLFLTYGLRAEWNPNFGEDAQPNLAPRYGVAFTRDVGGMTAKMRVSYGRSTRPPWVGASAGAKAATEYGMTSAQVLNFGNYDSRLPNPELRPEFQRGGEGGVELYFGTRASFVVTRFNQTVDGLIASPVVDSVRSLLPNPVFSGLTCAQWIAIGLVDFFCTSVDAEGFGYRSQRQNINAASLRNSGWELQGTFVAGPIATRATYSWVKSRSLGVDPKYFKWFSPFMYPTMQKGAKFEMLAEHTWALGMTYTRSSSTIALNVMGTGPIPNRYGSGDFSVRNIDTRLRLESNKLDVVNIFAHNMDAPAYVLADVSATHRFTAQLEGLFQIQNATNRYQNDRNSAFATIGRQTKCGFRVRL